MWVPAALISAATGAGLLAVVMAYLAVVERNNRVWGLWSASFAFDAVRSILLLDNPAHGTLTDAAAEALLIGHVGFLATGILIWLDVARPLRLLVIGTGVAVLWAGTGTVLQFSETTIHLPLNLFFGLVLGVTAWSLWRDAAPDERMLRKTMAVVLAVWTAQELLSATIGWHSSSDPLLFTAVHGYGVALAMLLIVAALRRRHAQALAAIDQAQRARAEVEHANQRLSDFASVSSDWFWEQDANLRFTYLSPSVWQYSSLTPEDHYGKTRSETQPLGVTDEDWAAHEAVLQRREPFRDFRFHRIATDGKRRCLSISGVPVFDDQDRFQGYRGVGKDLTDLITAEQRVRATNTQLAQALDARSEGLAFWDRDDRLVMCNQAYRDQSGKSGSILVPGVSYEDYIRAGMDAGEVPAAVGREEAWLQERLEVRRNLPYTVEIFRGDRWLLIREQRTPDGGTLLTATDISELKRREDALVKAVEQAQLANRAKIAFLATMSHELRTPLNAIIGFAEIIKSGQFASNSDVQSEYAGYIHESGAHLLAVINDLLDVSRIEAGRLVLDEKPFGLASLIDECDRMIRQKAEAEGLRLAMAAVDPGLGIRGDRRAFKQILINLLSNAVKFTESGGAITLTAERDAGARLRLVVRDTGIGVAANRVVELFEPFRQLENVHARRHHGTGLGLYITKNLVEAHGGTIVFESAVNQGSTVTITLAADRLIEAGGAVRHRVAV
ncbi:ATP-binding protein [Thalassobaculum sp.]|uniref:ATP-binding protein n=1 Tax=Thalassobaculum sp. TaxID=2022740 RepID=UPI0032ED01E7